MEDYSQFTPCGLELLSDQALRTTASNYNFKYVPGEQFQRIIRTVQRDRLKLNKDNVWMKFCSSETQSTMLRASKLETTPALSPCSIIQTKSSSIRIISSPSLQNKENIVTTKKESSWIYKAPKIRIMTDEEITNAVENAFKEVLDQAGNSKMQQLLTSRGDDSRENNALCTTETSSNLANTSDKDETTSETEEEILSTRSSKSLNQAEVSGEISTAHYVNPSQPMEKHTNEPINLSPKSTRSNSSKSSSISRQSSEKDKISQGKNVMVSSESIDQLNLKSESEIEEHCDNTCETSTPLSTRVEVVPQLTSTEKEDLREFLRIEEYILDSDINLSNFEEETDESSIEDTGQEKMETNIHPLVHIKQPTPGRNIPKFENHSTLRPIQSSPAIHRSASADTQFSRRKKAPSKQTDESPKISPAKAFSKTPPVTTPKSAGVSARSSRRTKIIKSPGRLSSTLIEQKQENESLMSKTATFQQKVLLSLEQIRINLNDIPQPVDILDLKRRQKRADEFSARLTRNYLYEIGRLMEEIQIVPKDDFLSRKDISVLSKVCALFNTLSQAVQTYLKHMNGFILDQKPKMLEHLLGVASKSTKICVHKTIFNKADPIVQDTLRSIKELEKYLREAHQKTMPLQEHRSQRSQGLKTIKSETSYSGLNRKLSMYDSMPMNKFGIKRKASGFRGATRLKSNFRNLVQTASTNSKDASKKSNRDVSSSKSRSSPVYIPASMENECDEENLKKGTPKMDQIETHIETVTNDDLPDDDLDKGNKCPANTSRTNINNNQNIDDIYEIKNESIVDSTAVEALESITRQQVKQLLGPLISSLGAIMPTTVSCTDAEITTIVNNLMASQLDGVGGGSKGPSITRHQREKTGNKFKDALQNSTSFPLDSTPQSYGNNANCKRELAMQNLHRIHKPQPPPVVVPAPNAFSVGELNDDDDDHISMTPSQQRRPHNISEALVAGSRTRINGEGGHCEGGGIGASETDDQTKKVLQLQYNKNVRYNTIAGKDQNINLEVSSLSPNNEIPPNGSQSHRNYVPMLTSNQPSMAKDSERTGYNRINEERLRFLEQMTENPLYVNECFSQPWKVVTKITNQIVEDVIHDVERSINFGEETFVRDFIKMELE